jgi:SAM-dependent methyltransferase
MAEWFADDTFWAAIYPFEFGETAFTSGEAQVEQALALSGVERGDALDLGCGPGRHAVPLAKRGFHVTAVDLSPFLLAKARERAAVAGVSVELVTADMRTFARAGAFDLALNLFTSFGYFEDAQDDARVVANLHRNLKPGGVLVMDVLSRERMAKVFQPTISQRLPDGTLRVQRHEIVDDWTRVKNEWLYIKDGEVRTYEFVLRVYSGQELKALVIAAGFGRVTLHGALDGRPYGGNAERLVVRAVK